MFKRTAVIGLLFLLSQFIPGDAFGYVLTHTNQSWCVSSFPTSYVAGSFTITESTNGEFKRNQNNRTLFFDAPAGFQFNTTAGTFSVTRTGTTDITAISIAATSTTRLTVTLTTPNATQVQINSITVNYQVRATAAGLLSKIIRNGGTFRIANSTAKPTAAQSLGDLLAEQSMAFTSCTTNQPITSNAPQGTIDNVIIQIPVVVTGTCNPFSVTQFDFNTDGGNGTGTNNPTSNITTARVYYSGTTNSFSPTGVFGSFNSPNGAFSITGSQALVQGTNYFWLVYDLPTTAIVGNLLDAQCTGV
ncbi:MAG TPA: BNR-repeat neuraminidase N-terminal domain-containing protein, partial [Bacteroidia bacterium]|nr:BNR-repeat neuraminidase N-terminal domain-containing protein [Bacteroidia bacterium]